MTWHGVESKETELEMVEDEINLVEMITRVKKRLNNNRAPDGFLHPSEMNKCSRIMFWNWTYGPPNNKKDEFTVGGKFAVDIGTRIHDMLEGLMAQVEGIKFEAEQGLESFEDNLRGTCDGFVTDEATGKKYVIEFKSTKSKLYEIFSITPKKEHWQQLQLYLHMSGLDIGFLFYFNKDDNRMAQHRVVKDPAFIETVTNRSKYIKEKFDKGAVPSRYLSCTSMEKLDKRCANYLRCKNYEAGKPVE